MFFFKSILGTSGQNLDNIEKYRIVEDKLSLMEELLNLQHLCPTAPDQLHCYPFEEKDPFVISRAPHVLFCGNQKNFQTKLVHGENGQRTRLIAVPSFAETQTIVLVDLDTLEASPIKFQTDLMI